MLGVGKILCSSFQKGRIGGGNQSGGYLEPAETELIVFGGFHEYSLEKLKKAK